MTPAQLEKAGIALYGPSWLFPLSEDLKVNERSVRRWVMGFTPIPDDIPNELVGIAKRRGQEIHELIAVLTGIST